MPYRSEETTGMSAYVNPTGPGLLHDHWCPAGGRLIPCNLEPCPFPFNWSCGTCPTEEPAIAAELHRRGITPSAWYREQRSRQPESTGVHDSRLCPQTLLSTHSALPAARHRLRLRPRRLPTMLIRPEVAALLPRANPRDRTGHRDRCMLQRMRHDGLRPRRCSR